MCWLPFGSSLRTDAPAPVRRCSRPAAAVTFLTLVCAALFPLVSPSAQRPVDSAPPPLASPGRVQTLRSTAALSPSVVGQFREPLAFQQASSGQYFVFDRRGHSVHSVDPDGASSWKVVEIGGESGRIIRPSAFALAGDGTFAVADTPGRRGRIQIFGAGGFLIGGFLLPEFARASITVGGVALGGVSTLAFTGTSLFLNQPETGSLITEYASTGAPVRSIGSLRQTGHEDDRDVHLAMNAAIPLVRGDGGFYTVFLAGTPTFRQYDARGVLLFERSIQGREIDALQQTMPRVWPRRMVEGTEVPVVEPVVRAAAVDADGQLWVALTAPVSYVYDNMGEKIRTVEFRAAGVISPTSLSFAPSGRLLVTPGCFEFPTR